MPSPVGHFLGGVAAAWLVMPREGGWRRGGHPLPDRVVRHATTLIGCAAVAPDLDILLGTHRTVTHSVGGVLLTFVAALALFGPARTRFAAALAAAVASHALLDWVSFDDNTPTGVMLLWPYYRRFFPPPFPLFMSISKDVLTLSFYTHNALAVVREVVTLAPLLAVIRWARSGSAGAVRAHPIRRPDSADGLLGP